jgi:hypothetical protein
MHTFAGGHHGLAMQMYYGGTQASGKSLPEARGYCGRLLPRMPRQGCEGGHGRPGDHTRRLTRRTSFKIPAKCLKAEARVSQNCFGSELHHPVLRKSRDSNTLDLVLRLDQRHVHKVLAHVEVAPDLGVLEDS